MILKELRHEKFSLNISILLFVIRVNLLPSLTTLVPLWFIVISLVFFYLCRVLFSSFLEFRGIFVHARNNSKYRDVAPLILCIAMQKYTVYPEKDCC